ncbi:MAG: LysM peptidoglycan-binding domain-containing protein [Nitrospirae bacterium]|nr:LysM peptidoglycan-binding domain-containing protein [Nitrospirota bacterium]
MKIRNISIVLSLIILSALLFSIPPNVSGEEALSADNETSYTIKKGDTLWDISGEYLRNPFLWSALWGKNKYIKNPDLIFPGDKLIIPGVEALSKTEAAGQQPSASDAGQQENPEEGVKPSEASTLIPEPPLPEEIDVPESIRSASPYTSLKPSSASGETGKVSVKQTPVPIIGEETVFMGGYIADKVSSAGAVSLSQDDRNVFAAGDTVNILFNKKEKAAVGDKFAIIRKPKALINTETGKQYGMLSVPIGVLEIYRIQGRDAGGRIIKSFDYITEGDMIQRLQPAVPVLTITRPAKGIKGHIIGLRGETVLASERNVVYLDKGTKDGLTPGVVLNVSGESPDNIPKNIIGELIVISVQSSTATALVTKSIEPFGVGSLFFK